MRYVLKADGNFVQTSNEASRLCCNRNQFVTWWESLGLEKLPQRLTIVDTQTDAPAFEAEYRTSGVLRWRQKTT